MTASKDCNVAGCPLSGNFAHRHTSYAVSESEVDGAHIVVFPPWEMPTIENLRGTMLTKSQIEKFKTEGPNPREIVALINTCLEVMKTNEREWAWQRKATDLLKVFEHAVSSLIDNPPVSQQSTMLENVRFGDWINGARKACADTRQFLQEGFISGPSEAFDKVFKEGQRAYAEGERKVTAPGCECASIMLADETRHFRGCPLREKYPTHEASFAEAARRRESLPYVIATIERFGADDWCIQLSGPSIAIDEMARLITAQASNRLALIAASGAPGSLRDLCLGPVTSLLKDGLHQAHEECRDPLPAYADALKEGLTCTKPRGHEGAHWAKGKHAETSWPNEEEIDPGCPVHGIGLRVGPVRTTLGGGVGWTTEATCTCGSSKRVRVAHNPGRTISRRALLTRVENTEGQVETILNRVAEIEKSTLEFQPWNIGESPAGLLKRIEQLEGSVPDNLKARISSLTEWVSGDPTKALIKRLDNLEETRNALRMALEDGGMRMDGLEGRLKKIEWPRAQMQERIESLEARMRLAYPRDKAMKAGFDAVYGGQDLSEMLKKGDEFRKLEVPYFIDPGSTLTEYQMEALILGPNRRAVPATLRAHEIVRADADGVDRPDNIPYYSGRENEVQNLTKWLAEVLDRYLKDNVLAAARSMAQRPRIICLCGSTRFSEAFQRANLEETLKGNIVLTVGSMMHSDDDVKVCIKCGRIEGENARAGDFCRTAAVGQDNAHEFHPLTSKHHVGTKGKLDALHKKKIELADEVLVLNVIHCAKCHGYRGDAKVRGADGCEHDMKPYIGESTRSEFAHAMKLGKPVRFLNKMSEEAMHELLDETRADRYPAVKLAPGHFYKSRDGARWCCIVADEFNAGSQIGDDFRWKCVCLDDSRISWFREDGRYQDPRLGDSQADLIEESKS